MVKLTKEEKAELCNTLTKHLPKLRKLLNLTQEDLANVSGLSRVTISQVEGGKVHMNWLHLNAILFICNANIKTKEYLYANNILGERFAQFVQLKNEDEPPEVNVNIDKSLVTVFRGLNGFMDNRSMY